MMRYRLQVVFYSLLNRATAVPGWLRPWLALLGVAAVPLALCLCGVVGPAMASSRGVPTGAGWFIFGWLLLSLLAFGAAVLSALFSIMLAMAGPLPD